MSGSAAEFARPLSHRDTREYSQSNNSTSTFINVQAHSKKAFRYTKAEWLKHKNELTLMWQEATNKDPSRKYSPLTPYEWQWDTACRALSGRNQIICAPTGAGKSTVWILIMLAFRYFKVKRFVVLIAVTKAMQDDQVRFDISITIASSLFCYTNLTNTLVHLGRFYL